MASDIYIPKLSAESPATLGHPRESASSTSQTRHAGSIRLFIAESLTCAAMIFLTCLITWTFERTVRSTFPEMLLFSSVTGLCWAVLLSRERSEHRPHSAHPIRETAGAVRVSLQLLFSLLPVAILLRHDVPWMALAISLVLVPPAITLLRHALTEKPNASREGSVSSGCVVVYGASEDHNQRPPSPLSSIHSERKPAIFLKEEVQSERNLADFLSFFEPEQRIATDLLQSLRCELLIIASDSSSRYRDKLVVAAQERGVPIMYLSENIHASERTMYNLPEASPHGKESVESSQRLYAVAKRALDLIVSSICLLLLAPIFLITAILIRLGSRGPALFVQQRVGAGGAIFRMYKFRSMVCSAARYERSPTTSEDPRITRIGRFLRRTSIDELPQLFNVFLGHMSLVGPRPEMPFIVHDYSSCHRLRLQVTPGITGLWQLSKDRANPIHHNLHHDLTYIRERSFSLDIAILIHTLLFAMQGGI